jgi:very-short-patch-repair endonuclease
LHLIKIKNITNKNEPRWCPFCNNKTEGKLYKIMKEIYPSIMYQLRVDWCKNVIYLPYDFYIQNCNIIIELDGPQHFRQIMDWKTPELQQKTDKYKEKCANENGYSIIRILQEDVFNDKYDWKTELVNNIEKIKINNIIQNIYMCKNNEYTDFINSLS